MPPHIASDVERARESPAAGEEINLVLVAKPGCSDDVHTLVRELGGTIEEMLPEEVTTVSLPQEELDQLCESESLESVAVDGEFRLLA